MMNNKENKGIYIVSEPATLIKGSGAYRHIEVGRTYLAKHFDIEFYPMCEVPSPTKTFEVKANSKPTKENLLKSILKSIGLWHTIKDLKILFDNHKAIFKNYQAIKAINPAFIYERSSFLNFSGLIISKWLGVPHFYENNGIKYLEHKEKVSSWLTWLWAAFEKTAYKKSDFVFFVGLWGSRLGLSTKNWINVENGVEKEYIERFESHQKTIEDKINICFIGSLMEHHGFYLLVEALKNIDTSNIHLHLFGSKMKTVVDELEVFIETKYQAAMIFSYILWLAKNILMFSLWIETETEI